MAVRLAAKGLVDFRQARLLDIGWWRRVNILRNALQDADDLEMLKAAYAFPLALLGNSSLTPESFKGAQTTAKENFNEILNSLRPWDAKTSDTARHDQIDELVTNYKKMVGDPKDPVFAAKLRASIEAERKRRAAVPAETDDARVERLLRERDRKKRKRRTSTRS